VQTNIIKNGFFITLEGPEGAGKSTQSRMLAEKLKSLGYDVIETREPGGTALGEELRRLIKHFDAPGAVCDEAELLMFGASRAQLVKDIIAPQLQKGGIVICDRFADSSMAYQVYARNLDINFANKMYDFTVKSYTPNLTLLFDLDVAKGRVRTYKRSGTTKPTDRLEAESLDFHRSVREGYLQIAKENAERFRIIDAEQDINMVHDAVMEVINNVFKKL